MTADALAPCVARASASEEMDISHIHCKKCIDYVTFWYRTTITDQLFCPFVSLIKCQILFNWWFYNSLPSPFLTRYWSPRVRRTSLKSTNVHCTTWINQYFHGHKRNHVVAWLWEPLHIYVINGTRVQITSWYSNNRWQVPGIQDRLA